MQRSCLDIAYLVGVKPECSLLILVNPFMFLSRMALSSPKGNCRKLASAILAKDEMVSRSKEVGTSTSNTALPSHACHRHSKVVPPQSLVSSTLYMGKRELDFTGGVDFLIPYRSDEGKKMLMDCIRSGSAENYLSLSEQFLTQSSPPSCGMATLAMVLNSLGVDPGRVWQKPWRWFTEEMLISCFPLEKTEETLGLTMEHFALIAECNGVNAQTFYGSETSLDDFRSAIRAVFNGTGDRRMVVAFDRQVLGQTGTGHYSPLGAYHEATDRLLVMDVARFKYPPYWVPVDVMWKSLRTVDPESRRSRGFFLMYRAPVTRQGVDAESQSHAKSIDEFLECMLNPNNSKLKEMASSLVHDVRKRILSCPCIGRACETLVDCSSLPVGKAVLDHLRSCELIRTEMQMQHVVGSVFKSEEDMRPIDFLIQSMPQYVNELLTLMIIDPDKSILPREALVLFDRKRLHYKA